MIYITNNSNCQNFNYYNNNNFKSQKNVTNTHELNKYETII